MDETVLYGTPSRYAGIVPRQQIPAPRQSNSMPLPSPNPRGSVPQANANFYASPRPPATPPPVHSMFIGDDVLAAGGGGGGYDDRVNQANAAAVRRQATPTPKEIPLHQQQAQRAIMRQRRQQRLAIEAAARAEMDAAGRATPRDNDTQERVAALSTPRPISMPSGTGHRLRPAERPQAGSSSKKLNPAWPTRGRVSNPLLQKTHVEFTEKVLRDDDPVSGISGVGRRCIVRLGSDDNTCNGTISFRGETQFKKGTWVGVTLDKPVGRNDGAVQGIRYFQCAPMHGVFVRESAVTVGPADGLTPGPPQRMLTRGKSSRQLRLQRQRESQRQRSPSPKQLHIDYDADSDDGGLEDKASLESDRSDEDSDSSSEKRRQSPRRRKRGITVDSLRKKEAREIIDDVYEELERSHSLSPMHRRDDGDSSESDRAESEDAWSEDEDGGGVRPRTLEQAIILKKVCAGILRNPRRAFKHFDKADRDSLGVISVDEAHRALRRLGIFLTMFEMAELRKAPGVGFDGQIMYVCELQQTRFSTICVMSCLTSFCSGFV